MNNNQDECLDECATEGGNFYPAVISPNIEPLDGWEMALAWLCMLALSISIWALLAMGAVSIYNFFN